MEPMARALQFTADFPVIVDLAVKRDGRIAVIADNRLIAAAQVDDFQPDRAQS